VQQLFSEELINSQERDHLKGNLIEPTQAFETQTAIACQNWDAYSEVLFRIQMSVLLSFFLLNLTLSKLYALDMTFDDDTKLFGLMRRYSDPEEIEELKRQVISYVRT